MSMHEDTPLPDNSAGTRTMAKVPAPKLEPHELVWGSGPPPPSPPQQPFSNIAIYLHALRRHWLLATGLALLCAGLIGPAVWFSLGPKYTAESYLRVAAQEQHLVFRTAEHVGRSRFDIYKGTQQQLVKSRFVLTAALRDPKVANLRCVKRQKDQIAYLGRKVKVNFPGDAEIMEVSLREDDPHEAATLVNAVVEAYLNEVVNVELNQRKKRRDQLDRVYSEKDSEVREQRAKFKRLANDVGSGDSKALALKQEIALQQFGAYRTELVRHQLEVRRGYGELKAKQALLENINENEVSQYELDTYVKVDPIAQQMLAELAWRRSDMNYNAMIAVPGTTSALAERQQRELLLSQQQFEIRAEELRQELRSQKRAAFEQDIKRLKTDIAIAEEQVAMLQEDVERQRQEAEKFGESSIDMEMMRAEIDHLDHVLNGIAEEREKLKVELRSSSRITPLQPAEPPKSPDRTGRIPLTAFAMLLGMCIPIGIVAWWDSRAEKINSSVDVSKGIGLPVIGAVPVIPSRAIRQLGSPSKNHGNWQVRLTESADGIAARVLRKAELEKTRVVLITSAISGEGKTTLATQLAMSLARSKRRVVLVDFDLRRPAFDEIYSLPPAPGVSEFLRGENGAEEIVKQTNTDGLAVITAGRWDRRALTALANGAAGSLFDRLRRQYDFVVVDASPVLPVADTRFVSQHVDAVIFSVLRDVSRSPRVSAAREILQAFGVDQLEAVVTGPSETGCYSDLAYEPRTPK